MLGTAEGSRRQCAYGSQAKMRAMALLSSRLRRRQLCSMLCTQRMPFLKRLELSAGILPRGDMGEESS